MGPQMGRSKQRPNTSPFLAEMSSALALQLQWRLASPRALVAPLCASPGDQLRAALLRFPWRTTTTMMSFGSCLYLGANPLGKVMSFTPKPKLQKAKLLLLTLESQHTYSQISYAKAHHKPSEDDREKLRAASEASAVALNVAHRLKRASQYASLYATRTQSCGISLITALSEARYLDALVEKQAIKRRHYMVLRRSRYSLKRRLRRAEAAETEMKNKRKYVRHLFWPN